VTAALRLLAAAILLAAGPALAEQPPKVAPGLAAGDALGAAAFEDLVEGRVLTYRFEDGTTWGHERYYPGRRVTWFPAETGECLEGKWYEAGPVDSPSICYDYVGDPASPHCFPFFLDEGRLLYQDGGLTLSVTELGPEHGLPFGCEYLGA
jgi:hypothetical protein